MTQTVPQSNQMVNEAALAVIRKLARTAQSEINAAFDSNFDAPLRMYASNPSDALLNFKPQQFQVSDGTGKSIPPLNSLIPTVVASSINFQTGATTGATFDGATLPTTTVGQFRRAGFTLLSTGTIKVLWSAAAATVGALANPGTLIVATGLPIGWIDLEATAATAYKTAGSATAIVENAVGGVSRIVTFGSGGGAGGGSGSASAASGVGDDLGSLLFKASINDSFTSASDDVDATIDFTAGKTDVATFDSTNAIHRLSYDASKTVTGTGTAMTLSGAPSFTIKVGDILIIGTEAKRITVVTSQTSITIESAFAADPSTAACCVSQVVYTKDLNNFAGSGVAPSAAFATTISSCLVTYEDTSALADVIFDIGVAPVIAYSVSADGSTYSSSQTRPTSQVDAVSETNLSAAGTNLYVRLFANKNTGSGAVNVLSYKAFFHKDNLVNEGGIVTQAYCFTDGVGTEINCGAPFVVGGKTRVTMNWSYSVGVNSGLPNGGLKVFLNGSWIPRYVDATITPDAHYHEITANTIELDQDYSSFNYDLNIVREAGVGNDVSTVNSTYINDLQSSQAAGFQGFVDNSATITVPYTTIVGRAKIPDIANDLRGAMGIERIPVQQIIELQNEFGPNGEKVFSVLNDGKGLIRFVGDWVGVSGGSHGAYISSESIANSYVEITFYGTGLNLLNMQNGGSHDLREMADGGAESANIYPTLSGLLNSRYYAPNYIIPVKSGLALGIHTVRIKVYNTTATYFQGFEILNENTSIKVNPGTAYIGGKKLVKLSQETLAYNSGFESGTLGTRGGHVVVYQKADGTIGKAVTPCATLASAFSSSATGYDGGLADHVADNEEMVRSYNFREFGCGRADDFSTLESTSSARVFTLDDNTTTLHGDNLVAGNNYGRDQLRMTTGLTFTFVGSGLDMVISPGNAGSTIDTFDVYIDGVQFASAISGSIATPFRVLKVVSGLKYTTHTVKVNRSGVGATGVYFTNFITYAPKKPTIPSGAIENHDYFILADFVANATAGNGGRYLATGVIRKQPVREFLYSGTWTFSGGYPTGENYSSGFEIGATYNAGTVEIPFFGTGFDYRFTGNQVESGAWVNGLPLKHYKLIVSSSSSTSITLLLKDLAGNTINMATGTTSGFYGANITSFTASTGAIVCSGNSGNYPCSLDVVTPIHSPKSNLYGELQNTLMVGNCSLSDNRKLTPVKDVSPVQKAWAQAVGVAAASTSSTALIPMPNMSVTVKTGSGLLDINGSTQIWANSANVAMDITIYVDGVVIGSSYRRFYSPGAGSTYGIVAPVFARIPVAAGSHKVDIYYSSPSGTTLTVTSSSRSLDVKEI